jgi:hypothetical protein
VLTHSSGHPANCSIITSGLADFADGVDAGSWPQEIAREFQSLLRDHSDVTDTSDLQTGPPDGRNQADLWSLAQTATVGVAGLAAFIYLLGQIVTRVRLGAAHVPVDAALATTGQASFFGAGLQAALLMTVAFAGTSVLAYVLSGWRWSQNRHAWDALIVGDARTKRRLDQESGVQARRRGRLVRVVAGYDILVAAGVLGLVATTLLAPWGDQLAGSPINPVETVVFWMSFALFAAIFASLGPRRLLRLARPIALLVVAAAALLALASIGLLVLAGAATAVSGRFMARRAQLPSSISGLLTTPYPFVLMAIYILVAIAQVAIPPVSFPHAVITTSAGQESGGYLTRTSDGIAMVVCTELPDATSSGQHIVFIESKDIRGTTLGAGNYDLDNGERPSLLTIALNALGFNSHLQAVLPRTRFHPTHLPCTTATPPREIVSTNPTLGPGVLVGPAPASQAEYGERPIEVTTPPKIAALARLYQPTVEVTVADRFWPVSVGAVLAERSQNGDSTCIVRTANGCSVRDPSLGDLMGSGSSPDDYLEYPAILSADPTEQFDAFLGGQLGIGHPVPTSAQWELNPGSIDPWATAQVYFYYAENTNPAAWPAANATLVGKFVALQYWFLYPYHYFPTVVSPALMNDAPLAGDYVNTDLHEGDWEHVTVLLDAMTKKPLWLYMARHSAEGEYYPWHSPALMFDGTHPIVQAAFGSHSTYDNNCGQRPRVAPVLPALTRGRLADWIVCGSGRFAFPASTTPLVDIAKTPWACWKGHFGVATPSEVGAAKRNEASIQRSIDANYMVAGPRSPLWQAENGRLAADQVPLLGAAPPTDRGVCANGADPTAPEQASLAGGAHKDAGALASPRGATH